jgi:hypothetical protein
LELPDNPSFYQKVGWTPSHHTNLWGTECLSDELLAVATKFRARYPAGQLPKYNDMSLPWGGLFDKDSTWAPPHCGHRFGNTCDLNVGHFTTAEKNSIRAILELEFDVLAEPDSINPRVFHSSVYCGAGVGIAGGPSGYLRLASFNGNGVAPEPATQQALQVGVDVTVTYDAGTQRYTYAYRLRNLPTSTDTVDVFGIRELIGAENVTSPQHWEGYPAGNKFYPPGSAVVWFCTDPGPPPAGWGAADSARTYTSTFAPVPGDTVTGFTIVSPNPPGSVQFFARKWGPMHSHVFEYDLPPFWSVGVTGTTTGPTRSIGVPELDSIPRPRQGLLRSAPNPFSGTTTITFDTSSPSDVELEIYDPFGRRVAGILRDRRPAGRHSIIWNGLNGAGQNVPAGVYFVRLVVNGIYINAKPLVLLK